MIQAVMQITCLLYQKLIKFGKGESCLLGPVPTNSDGRYTNPPCFWLKQAGVALMALQWLPFSTWIPCLNDLFALPVWVTPMLEMSANWKCANSS
jgi:hypothetical protein